MINQTQNTKQAQIQYASQCVVTFLLRARIATEKGLTSERIKAKDELIARLNSRTNGELTDQVKALVTKYDWSKERGLDKFARLYSRFEQKYMGAQ